MMECQGERCVVTGALTHDTVAGLLDEGGRLLKGGRLVFDLSGVDVADSSALSLMLEWSRQATRTNTRVAFVGLAPSIQSLIDLYGLTELIPIAAE